QLTFLSYYAHLPIQFILLPPASQPWTSLIVSSSTSATVSSSISSVQALGGDRPVLPSRWPSE
ncbi:MAG: hypothetical protein ACRC6M_01010, partial [Microcystaceae cyanobacterium]